MNAKCPSIRSVLVSLVVWSAMGFFNGARSEGATTGTTPSTIVYAQDFELLNIGMLDGQDSWNFFIHYSTIAVENAIAHSGTMAVSCSAINGSTVDRTVPTLQNGTLDVSIRSTSLNGTHFELYVLNSTSGRGLIQFQNNGMVGITTPAGVADLYPFATNVWYDCHLEFDVPDNLYRFSIDQINGGAWSNWYGMMNTGDVTAIRFGTNLGNTATTYFDDVVVRTASSGGPVISSVTSKSGRPGTGATIRGTGFSQIKKQNVIYFGSKKAKLRGATTTRLRVTIPRLPKGTYGVYVVVNGQTSNTVPFQVK